MSFCLSFSFLIALHKMSDQERDYDDFDKWLEEGFFIAEIERYQKHVIKAKKTDN
jgi:hypothetical protein